MRLQTEGGSATGIRHVVTTYSPMTSAANFHFEQLLRPRARGLLRALAAGPRPEHRGCCSSTTPWDGARPRQHGAGRRRMGGDVCRQQPCPTAPEPLAQAYAGHQFGGFFAPARRWPRPARRRTDRPPGTSARHRLQGVGRTPFARQRRRQGRPSPMLREVLDRRGHARAGHPTTRALAVVATGEPVHRERTLPGAVLTRRGGEPHPGWDLRILRRARRRCNACASSPSIRSRGTTPSWQPHPSPSWRCCASWPSGRRPWSPGG